MQDTPHDLGDGTPERLAELEAAGALSVSGADDPDADAFALEMAKDVEAFDAELIASEGPDALTSDRALRLLEFRTAQAAERRAALHQAELDDDVIGYVLGVVRKQRDWSHEQLADWLGISVDDVGRLASERRPRALNGLTLLYDPEPINEIADRYGAHRERLYEAFDQGDL